MPKESERKLILNDLNETLKTLAVYGEENTELFDEMMNLYAKISSFRYLNARVAIPKSDAMMNLLWSYDDKDFKVLARMSKHSFIHILRLIQNHAVFQSNSNQIKHMLDTHFDDFQTAFPFYDNMDSVLLTFAQCSYLLLNPQHSSKIFLHLYPHSYALFL